MKPEEILALMNEPACAHNRKAKSGCAKPQPGATQGGCCFDGARNALLPIADVAHMVHGPIGCAGSSWDNRGTRSSGADTYRFGMTTDLTDMDVIMGRGEKRLFQRHPSDRRNHIRPPSSSTTPAFPASRRRHRCGREGCGGSSACRSCPSIARASTATRISATASPATPLQTCDRHARACAAARRGRAHWNYDA